MGNDPFASSIGSAGPFPIHPLQNLTEADEASYKGRGLPAHPPILGPKGQYYGHEWARWLYDTLDQRVDQILETQFPSGASILDLGCATGARAGALAAAGHRVTAVDIVDFGEGMSSGLAGSPSGIQGAGTMAPITFLHADIRRLPVEDLRQAFDLVHARRVITFIRADDIPAVLQAVATVLKEGGLFVASIVSREVRPSEMQALHPLGSKPALSFHPGVFGHRFSEMHHAMRDHGLAVVEAFTDFEIEVGLIARRLPAAETQ